MTTLPETLPALSGSPTLHDVARRAGVSPMTVSNVINGKSGVRPVTRQRVLDAVAATGYRVNPVARALAGGRNRMICVYSPQLNQPYAFEVIHGAARAAEALNYDLAVMMLSESSSSVLSVVSQLSVGALLIQPGLSGPVRPASLPPHVVSVDGPGERRLTVDNYGGAALAMKHLLRLGHTRIAFVSGLGAGGLDSGDLGAERQQPSRRVAGREDRDAAERLRGYLEGMAAAQLQVPRGYVQHGDYLKASGEQAARRLLDLKRPPTAVFASGDAMALGVVHVAQNRGLSVPADLSVVGFDDLPIASASRPGLSTVRQPIQLLGETAVKMIVALAAGQDPPPPPPFPTELIVRESTAPPAPP